MSRERHVIDLVKAANPAPAGSATLDEAAVERLLAEVTERSDVMRTNEMEKVLPPVQRPPQRGRSAWAFGVAVLLVAVVGVGWYLATVGGDDEIAGPNTTVTTTTVASPTTVVSPTTTVATPATTAPPPTTATTLAPPEPVLWAATPRSGLAYDSASQKLVVFGGYDTSSGIANNDTWIFDVVVRSWTKGEPASVPFVRYDAAMAYDPGLDRIVLFGGGTGDVMTLNDLWTYDVDSDTWEQMTVEGDRPPNRRNTTMHYVESLGGMLLSGGETGQISGGGDRVEDMWLLDTTDLTWTELPAPPEPGVISGVQSPDMAYDPGADLVLGPAVDGIVWVFSPADLSWSSRPFPASLDVLDDAITAHNATRLVNEGMTYDPARQRLVGVSGPHFVTYDIAADVWDVTEIARIPDVSWDFRPMVVPEHNVIVFLEPSEWEGIREFAELDLSTLTWSVVEADGSYR